MRHKSDEEKTDIGDEEIDLRIDSVGAKNELKELFKEKEFYDPVRAKGASEEVQSWPKTVKKHMEGLIGEEVDGGRIEKSSTGGLNFYQRNYCSTVCEMKRKAKKKCDEEDDEAACEKKETLGKIEDDLNCSCQVKPHRTEYSSPERWNRPA